MGDGASIDEFIELDLPDEVSLKIATICADGSTRVVNIECSCSPANFDPEDSSFDIPMLITYAIFILDFVEYVQHPRIWPYH